MNSDIKISCDIRLGEGFVPSHYLLEGETEYRIRDTQLAAMGKSPSGYRNLLPFELETLVRNNNSCSDWSLFCVSDPFTPELVHNTFFSGLIRIGALERVSLEHHDLHLSAGISNSRIIACDIGDNCVISNCSYLAHYVIGNHCMLIDNAEIHASNHSKFGNGILIEGEEENVRITIDVMNEAGGRWIYPFDGITCADAYLWARNRQDPALMKEFARMTESMFDRRRGRYGSIGHGSVLKSNGVVKDVAIGESAYIKGANKLKNLTINSCDEAKTQIGEGVELVNGIIGVGCKIFYGSKAVRFVMLENSSLKYGARLIHSVLGENSTVSCCEILNNLIFPAHEQHHNTSFLIASLVKGQTNMAAGATIGSNHNSRAPDGEIEAGRGFWPGLCTSVKHSSKFASFCLLAKGDYRYELDIPFPFCLVDNDYKNDRLLLSPAYWWTRNAYALMRNESKFLARDKRTHKDLAIEYSPFAPDTAEEMLTAIDLLEYWTGKAKALFDGSGRTDFSEIGRETLSKAEEGLPFEVLIGGVENSPRECLIKHPARAWRAYREMLTWFAGREIAARLSELPEGTTWENAAMSLEPAGVSRCGIGWENLGGMLVSTSRLNPVLARAARGEYRSWSDFRQEYSGFASAYPGDKSVYAWCLLGKLYGAAPGMRGPSRAGLKIAFAELGKLSELVEKRVYDSRAKDWENKFRRATFRSDAEMKAVVGTPSENGSIQAIRKETADLRSTLEKLSNI
jgi:NDP-sugar pyrophosphorylase family protein